MTTFNDLNQALNVAQSGLFDSLDELQTFMKNLPIIRHCGGCPGDCFVAQSDADEVDPPSGYAPCLSADFDTYDSRDDMDIFETDWEDIWDDLEAMADAYETQELDRQDRLNSTYYF